MAFMGNRRERICIMYRTGGVAGGMDGGADGGVGGGKAE